MYRNFNFIYVLQFNLNEINALFQQTGQNMADLFTQIYINMTKIYAGVIWKFLLHQAKDEMGHGLLKMSTWVTRWG